ncbi:hypothetical protein H8E88_02765 [candidate division KSB1 bacterium]|nr:hypothetical protein [candidate division KSB1 bacterium]MBL7093746.1 hypothetical protein [candidate division KSB1 bacterium]
MLHNQLHIFEIERRKIFTSYGVNSIKEFDQLLINNPDEESDMLESFQKVDYLSFHIEDISRWIKEINGNGQPN